MDNQVKKKQGSFLSNQHGGVAILFAFALVMLIIAMGVSIEMGRIFLLRTKAFNALDTATLAAASIATKGITTTELNARAQPFFKANFPPAYLDSTIKSPLQIKFANGVVSGKVTMNMNLFFGNFLPFKNIDVPVSTQVTRRTQNVEIALALDHTSSMCIPDSCGSGSLWQGLKDAMEVMRDTLNGTGSGLDTNNIYYSYIPFRHTVMLDKNKAQYVPPPEFTQAVDNLPPMQTLTTDIDGIIQQMKKVDMHKDEQGGTNTSIGTWWAWESLRPQNRNAFPHPPADPDRPKPMPYQADFDKNNPTFKYVLLLTDGVNAYYYNAKKYVDIMANNSQQTFCGNIKQEGIIVYTIGYGDTVAASGPVQDMLRKCASGEIDDPEDKSNHFFLPKTAADLKVVFQKIALAISSLLLTQ